MAGAETFHVALRRRVLERDIFFFGTAMAGILAVETYSPVSNRSPE